MYGYIYITTNTVNGRKYIGQKKSNKFLGDRYLGSGVHLTNAIKKYGREIFTVDLIEWCDTYEDINERERYWISYYNAVDSSDFYNESYGGQDVSPMKGKKRSKKSREQQSQAITGKNNPFYGRKHSEETIQKIKDNMPDLSGENNPIYGKIAINNGLSIKFINPCNVSDLINKGWKIGSIHPPYTEESKKKLSESHKGLLIGDKNPMYGKLGKDSPHYGKVKITDGANERLVNPCELNDYIAAGWTIGRKTKGRKYVNDGIKEFTVSTSQLEDYLYKGYKKGRLCRNDKNTTRE